MDGFKCEGCDLKIEDNGSKYTYFRPGWIVLTKLQDYELLKRAYETGICPLCGLEMNKL